MNEDGTCSYLYHYTGKSANGHATESFYDCPAKGFPVSGNHARQLIPSTVPQQLHFAPTPLEAARLLSSQAWGLPKTSAQLAKDRKAWIAAREREAREAREAEREEKMQVLDAVTKVACAAVADDN